LSMQLRLWWDECSTGNQRGTVNPFDDEHEYINVVQLIERLEGLTSGDLFWLEEDEEDTDDIVRKTLQTAIDIIKGDRDD